jgi:hypothetical protein
MAKFPHPPRLPSSWALVAGLIMSVALLACGRPAQPGHTSAPPASFQALVVGTPDAQGNRVTTLFDSTAGRTLTMPAPGNASEPLFALGGRISYLLPSGVQSADPAAGTQRTEATEPALLAGGHAWSSRTTLAYLAYPSHPGPDRRGELVIRPQGAPSTTVPLPASAGRGQVRFSPDGTLVLLVDATGLQVRRLDGRLVFAPPVRAGSPPSEAVWASDGTLYFWDARGVNASDPRSGATTTVLPGVRWYNPDAAPDGRHVVFEVRDGQRLPALELLDTATGRPVAGFGLLGASHARFVSQSELWYHEEVVCDACRDPTRPAEEIVRYDLAQRTGQATGVSGFVSDVRTLPGR